MKTRFKYTNYRAMVHRLLVYMYLLSVPSVSSRYFKKIKRTSYLGKLPALSLEILSKIEEHLKNCMRVWYLIVSIPDRCTLTNLARDRISISFTITVLDSLNKARIPNGIYEDRYIFSPIHPSYILIYAFLFCIYSCLAYKRLGF